MLRRESLTIPPRAVSNEPSAADLTTREMRIRQAVALGDSYRQIGAGLGVKAETVKKYVSVLLQKIYLRNRVELAVLVALEVPGLLRRDRNCHVARLNMSADNDV